MKYFLTLFFLMTAVTSFASDCSIKLVNCRDYEEYAKTNEKIYRTITNLLEAKNYTVVDETDSSELVMEICEGDVMVEDGFILLKPSVARIVLLESENYDPTRYPRNPLLIEDAQGIAVTWMGAYKNAALKAAKKVIRQMEICE